MHLLQKYLLSNVYRSPDEPAASEPAAPVAADNALAADPPVADGGDPPADPPVADPPADPAAKPHGNTGQTPWYMKEITTLRALNREKEDRLARVEGEASAARELAERLQRGEPKPGEPPTPAPRRAAEPDFDTAVLTKARELTHAQQLFQDTSAIKNAGMAAFTNFGETLGLLNTLGATADDFVLDLIAVDKANAHVLLDKIAKDPEMAISLVKMDSRYRIAELTRMSAMTEAPKPAAAAPATPAAPAAKPLSNAPKPKPDLAPISGKEEGAEFADESSDKAFSDAWNRRYKKTG